MRGGVPLSADCEIWRRPEQRLQPHPGRNAATVECTCLIGILAAISFIDERHGERPPQAGHAKRRALLST